MPTISFATLPFDSQQAADARSRELWTAILGRAKYAQDTTEYLYPRVQSSDDSPLPDGVDIAIVIAERDEHLDTLLRQDQMTPDEIAALVSLYPEWSSESVAYTATDIVAYGGTLYRIVQAHTSQQSWMPDATPALWEPCAPVGVIPEWIQPLGAHDSYAIGDKVTHNGSVWESTVDNNVWEPGVYGWQVVE